MDIKIGDIFRYYDWDGEFWLGAVTHRTQSAMSMEWLLPLHNACMLKPRLRWSLVRLFDKAT